MPLKKNVFIAVLLLLGITVSAHAGVTTMANRDDLIGKCGIHAGGAPTRISRTQAQHLSMMVPDAMLGAVPCKAEILFVIRKDGDQAMDFVWKNKLSLAVAALLASFLFDPETYIYGAKDLIVDPLLVRTITQNANWAVFILVCLGAVFAPFLAVSITKAIVGRRHTSTQAAL